MLSASPSMEELGHVAGCAGRAGAAASIIHAMSDPSSFIYTPDQVRELDRIAIEELGIPGYELMSRAGQVVFDLGREQISRRRGAGWCCAARGTTPATAMSLRDWPWPPASASTWRRCRIRTA